MEEKQRITVSRINGMLNTFGLKHASGMLADLLEVAEEGESLTKQLCSKATSHRRALEKEKA